MKIIFFFLLISLCLNKITLYIENLYLTNVHNEKFKDDLLINLDIKENNIPQNIIANNIFKITLESENINEKFQKIIFECIFIKPINSKNSYIQCLLKKNTKLSLKGPFYFTEECFEKSFNIKYQKKLLNCSLEILKPTFYFGMIRSFSTKENFFGMKLNYKITDTIIPIAMALDDGYTLTTIVAITSIMENSFKTTKYNYYIMIPPNFSIINKRKIKNLEKKYKECSIKFINMTHNFIFNKAKVTRVITIPSYYRLILSDLLPHIEKIIYLDGDILSFVDLKEMYIIDMENLYFRGFLDILKDPFNPKSDIYICAGVLLINLEELRKDDMVNKMYNFTLKNKNKLYFQDQTIINAVGYPKLGILPAKFGIFDFKNLKTLYRKTRKYRYKYKYSKRELKNAYYHPKILHYNKIKPWKKRNNFQLKLWWKYASLTDHYEEMNIKYKLYRQKLKKKKKFKK